MFYLENYQGHGTAEVIAVAATKTVRLPDRACKFVKLFRWNATDDEQFTLQTAASDIIESNNAEVYWGLNGVLCGQLFQGRETELLPVSNANQITIRNPKAGNILIYFAYFK